MTKFNKPCIVKSGTVLQTKDNETWFAIKARGINKKDSKEFKTYLRECCVEFLRPDKGVNNAPNTSPETSSVEKGKGEIEKTESPRESETGKKSP